MKVILAAALLLFSAGLLCADNVVFESGPKKVQLLELFTSEGCSSCPPAEASLTRLVKDSRLWREFVPIAFHVDYWDRLGWKDPFASPEWTKRQRAYAANWNADNVYTPNFVLDGREWGNATVPVASAEAASGILRAIVRGDNNTLVSFEPANGKTGDFEVYLARLGFGLNIHVRAGENNGRSLHHDFVVLSLIHEKLGPVPQELRFPSSEVEAASRPDRIALAVWVTNAGDIRPLQAGGGWLPTNPSDAH